MPEDMTPEARRGPWSQQEDHALLQLVKLHGPSNWVKISQLLGTRSPKQCRERYHQNLKPSLNHAPITPEEGELIESYVQDMGKQWANIARRLEGRSDNAVKNWWNGGMNRRRRLLARTQGGIDQQFNETAQPLAFARPAHVVPPHRQILVPVSRQPRVEPPLTSPAHSEASIPDSLGETPSLVSDSSSHSHFSVPSPSIPRSARFLPLPDPSQAPPAGYVHSSPTFGSQLPTRFAPDRSPSHWSPRDISKPQHMPANYNQRLEQLSEIAARSDLQQQTQTQPYQQGLPAVHHMANYVTNNVMHGPPSSSFARPFIPLEPRLAGVSRNAPAQHLVSTTRLTAALPETPQPSSTVKRKADDTDPTTPPDRKRMAVSAILR